MAVPSEHVRTMATFAVLRARVLTVAIAAAVGAGPLVGQELRIDLNIPSYRVEVLRGDSLVRTFRVAVGLRTDPTPTGDFAITEVTWNPWWRPPHRAWARRDTVMPPGSDNPMGIVKLSIGNMYYLHGTPFAASIGHMASHGCIRMRQRDAIELAHLVLASQPDSVGGAKPGATAPIPSETVTDELAVGVPVRVRYALAEVRRDSLHLYPDIYRTGRANLLNESLAALAGAGVDTARVNRARLRTLMASSAKRHVKVAVASVLRGTGRPGPPRRR